MFFPPLHSLYSTIYRNHHHHHSSFPRNFSVSPVSDLKLQHKRQMKDAHDEYDIEKSRIDHRDAANAQEIDTLRRKCICLTKL
jgi:hypothetical protein